jgi:hypothetical protein
MHEYLRTEAHDLRTSMNKLCISKLLQVIEQDLIPTERSGGSPSSDRKPALAAAHAGSNHSSQPTTTNSSPITHHHTPIGSNY